MALRLAKVGFHGFSSQLGHAIFFLYVASVLGCLALHMYLLARRETPTQTYAHAHTIETAWLEGSGFFFIVCSISYLDFIWYYIFIYIHTRVRSLSLHVSAGNR